jgi:large subunit ribosomal protein L23
VTVVAVNTMNYMGKKKRQRGPKYGRREDWKRAIVTLKAGQKIETV